MPDPTARVQQALDEFGLGVRIQTFDLPTSTAEEAAAAVGCELGAIVKSLCFLIDDRPVLVLTAGDRRVDSKALRRIFDVSKRKCKIADPATVKRATGFAVGGVPPVGQSQPLPTLIDESLSRFEIVYAAAGTPHSLFAISYRRLVQITGGEVHDLT
jgi:prolyl-tRNA editing enzyme YbaK/EbsC (Cys-tRNA(Pro) deacylase)